MKIVYALTLFVIATFMQLLPETSAVTEPVCGYKNSQDDMVFLKYLPYAKRGEEYVDFGTDGKCLKRATCTDTFQTVVDECKKFPVTCENKKRYDGVFPACCVKC
ncbi:uncharacterized protein [Musca autumnalis]|uniref:uncharacterized protein n=1 Tax=Musca autumnalis TaxID=221902 RepID=UPI003CF45796